MMMILLIILFLSVNDNSASRSLFQSICALLNSALYEAHNAHHTSLAVPAIGTGNLSVPDHLVAKWMFEVVEEFSRVNNGSTLKNVRIVIFCEDIPNVRIIHDYNEIYLFGVQLHH